MLYDLHCHSKLSLCASRTSEISDFARYADEASLPLIGIADHAWDAGLGIPSGFYAKQDYERLFARIRPDGFKVKILFGAEGEYAQGLLAVRRSTMKKLDYIIIPHSHTHMKGLVLPEGCESPRAHGRYLFNSLVALLHHPDADCVFGIAHPFAPCGKSTDETNEILSAVTDEEFEYIGRLAASRGVYLELNAASVTAFPLESAPECGYARFFRGAKKAGARFFYGSDNHSPVPKEKNRLLLLPEYVKAFGLCDDDFKDALSALL